MLILVTGLYGFTGQYVQAELEKSGHRVVGLTSDLTDQRSIADEVSEIQPEAVIHLAGLSFIAHGNANLFYNVNLIGTRNLLEALASNVSNIQSILLASSANIYGNRSEGILSESTKPAPVNDYAVSKYAMEQMAWLWLDKLPLFIVRPFNYTGVGQDEKFLIPKIVSHFKAAKSIIELGNLDVWREFGDVRSVASIYKKLIEICPVGETLNICTGKPFSLRDVIKLCENITGQKMDVKVNPELIRSNEVRILAGDNSLLQSQIDNLEFIDLKETLAWMLEIEPV